jgi:hypothetical protein
MDRRARFPLEPVPMAALPGWPGLTVGSNLAPRSRSSTVTEGREDTKGVMAPRVLSTPEEPSG